MFSLTFLVISDKKSYKRNAARKWRVLICKCLAHLQIKTSSSPVTPNLLSALPTYRNCLF